MCLWKEWKCDRKLNIDIFIALWEYLCVCCENVSNFIELLSCVFLFSLVWLCVCVFDIKINDFDVFNTQYAVIIQNEQETTTATYSIQ